LEVPSTARTVPTFGPPVSITDVVRPTRRARVDDEGEESEEEFELPPRRSRSRTMSPLPESPIVLSPVRRIDQPISPLARSPLPTIEVEDISDAEEEQRTSGFQGALFEDVSLMISRLGRQQWMVD